MNEQPEEFIMNKTQSITVALAAALSITALVFAVAVSLRPRDPAIAKLEARIHAIEIAQTEQRDHWTAMLTDLQTKILAADATLAGMETNLAKMEIALLAEIRTEIARRSAAIQTPATNAMHVRLSGGTNATRLVMGAPVHVYNQIAERARAKWPGEYDMQNYEIKKQIEHYLKLKR